MVFLQAQSGVHPMESDHQLERQSSSASAEVSAESGVGGMASAEAADLNAIEEVSLAYENVKVVDCLDVSKEGADSWEAAMKR